MTDDDAEWWALSAAIAWIAARRPLRREHWPEDIVPSRLGPSGYLSDSVRLPEAIKRMLAAQDDGVDAAMDALGALLKNAAAAGRVRLRGKGPWAPEPVEPCVMGRSRVKDAKATFIAAEEFTRDRIAFFVETESIGPGEDPYDAADELDYQPRDSRAFPRWEDVQVAAAGLRAVWPDPVEPVTALDDALNENPFAEGRDDVLTTKPSATERRPERPGRPRYTRDALEFWFVSRRNMPFETLPTEAEDHAAARAYFTGRVPRDPFREIRRKLTPPEWRKTGPRKKLPGAHPRDLSRD